MSIDKLNIYCVTNRVVPKLEKLDLILAGVGEDEFPKNYFLSNIKENIFYKEKAYSELTFHYWYWKNKLDLNKKDWNGFSQRRRHWIKSTSENKIINVENFNQHILTKPDNDWKNFESIITKPIKVNKTKKMKIIKRGWKSLIKDPNILFDKKKHNILLHFDMHHGYGNLKKAILVMDENDRDEFNDFVNTNVEFNPHIMYISKNIILDKWFKTLFSWLERCEKFFGVNNLEGYDTGRIYAYLAERYASFWFKKYTKYKEHPWTFLDL
jgi:hypothetical protein